jgi:flavorubredoxin
MYNDLVDQSELFAECIKYYANILTPFSKLVERKISELLALNLPVAMICPSHGVIWRKDPLQIVKKYREWAAGYQENQITVIYDTMWNGTRRLAEAIAEGVRQMDPGTEVKLFNAARSDKNDIVTEVFKSKAIFVGSPTINKGVLSSIAAVLEMIKGLGFIGKKAASFGCYGWSGESVKIIRDELARGGFEIINDGVRVLWHPDEGNMENSVNFVKSLADLLKK